jgi:hypothetical protein
MAAIRDLLLDLDHKVAMVIEWVRRLLGRR